MRHEEFCCPPCSAVLKDTTIGGDRKEKKPLVKCEDLKIHISALSDTLLMPYFQNSKFINFKVEVESLLECLTKYSNFLQKQQTRSLENHRSTEPIRSLSDAWSMKFVHAVGTTPSPQYKPVYDVLWGMNNYEHLWLYTFQPDDSIQRRNWLENFILPFPVQMYTHMHGNYVGNFVFAWKVSEDDHSSMFDVDVLSRIRAELPTFSTRAMRKEFTERYARIPGIQPAILRDMYRFLTQDTAAAETSHQAEVDERVAIFLLQSDDTDLFHDLRKNNGRPKNSSYDPFWNELGKFFEESAVVHERRHGAQMYMPLAISMTDLKNQIMERLPLDTPSPSVSWMRLNFWPMNTHTRAAMAYTGRFQVKHAVQQRLLRARHEDSSYAFYQFTMMKEMAVMLRDYSTFLCLDDKSVVPIGEPENPISTGVRAHHKALMPKDVKLAASDHDFHVHGAIPSVLFHVEIPENARDSFYQGTVHVTLKDKVFTPSSALRHAAETTAILRNVASQDGVDLETPILFLFTDGGPDHRSTFWTVQLSCIVIFLALDLDLLVTARTAPNHSYANPAERCMSLLNMALQNVALSRDKMDETAEFKVKSLNSLKKLRDACRKQPALKEALQSSLEPVIATLMNRFSRLTLKDESVQVHDAASSEAIDDLVSILDIFQNEDGVQLTQETLSTKKDIDKFPRLSDFIKRHCRFRHYSFQVMKCTAADCGYCTLNPRRVPQDVKVDWLPDCVGDGPGFKPFQQVYGTDTNDQSRPSLNKKDAATERDRKNKSMLVSAKVRGFIICGECGKRRCVFGTKKLTPTLLNLIDRIQEELTFTCGSAFLPEDSPHFEMILVREGISCSSMIESTYYSSILVKFVDICVYCGDSEDLQEGPDMDDLRRRYGVVRPLCTTCAKSGKQPQVRCAMKIRQ